MLKDSPLKTVADLKGKKVAFAKGSNVNYFVVKVLEKAGLTFSDIQPAPPRAGRCARRLRARQRRCVGNLGPVPRRW